MQTVALVDYGSGNLHSAAKALERAAREADLNINLELTGDAAAVRRADRIVLPGVGAFADCMGALSAIDGMVDALNQRARSDAVPFLGICVGMQLMARQGEEHGLHNGLGWIDAIVAKITPNDPALKIPHMGWNTLDIAAPHPVLEGINSGEHVYFVHSYHMRGAGAGIAAQCSYGGAVTAAVQDGSCFGTQFHPEKSQNVGLRLLRNFLKWSA
ncbi:MAG: imidazole glycerol phosphate synthase subunit HisH [Pseudomonadota bacterium]